MFGFIKKIKEIYYLSDRFNNLDNQIKEVELALKKHTLSLRMEFDTKINELCTIEYQKLEKKLQEMTFAYTRNLDDTKSEYLKRYLESRLNGMSNMFSELPRMMDKLKEERHLLLSDVNQRIDMQLLKLEKEK